MFIQDDLGQINKLERLSTIHGVDAHPRAEDEPGPFADTVLTQPADMTRGVSRCFATPLRSPLFKGAFCWWGR